MEALPCWVTSRSTASQYDIKCKCENWINVDKLSQNCFWFSMTAYASIHQAVLEQVRENCWKIRKNTFNSKVKQKLTFVGCESYRSILRDINFSLLCFVQNIFLCINLCKLYIFSGEEYITTDTQSLENRDQFL